MSNTSGTANQATLLPKAGSALYGIAEKFPPELFTGRGNSTMPITLPPGRNGFQPQLPRPATTAHSNRQGNGPFRLGWSLSVPGVTLKTCKEIPCYQGKDVYVLSGAEDLVVVNGGSGSNQYHPRTEGLFAHIVRHHDPNNDDWEL